MNIRIRPDTLNNSPYKEQIHQLVLEWMHAGLSTTGQTYDDYTDAIKILLLTTQDLDQTTLIVQAVLSQAISLKKTAEWVDQELKFEGMIHGADRADFLRFDLQQANSIDDSHLDSYNERLYRFQPKD